MNLDIYEDAERLAKRYGTRDPFELLDAMNVVVKFTDKFPKDGLKGFCTFMNKTKYVVINDRLSSIEARVVAGHEAGHIIRHATELKVGAFQDNDIYMATGKKEREANVFAADFLIRDADVLGLKFFQCFQGVAYSRPVLCVQTVQYGGEGPCYADAR